MNYPISKAHAYEADKILILQKLAYVIEAERYGNYDIPPLKQTREELIAQFDSHIILKATSDNKIIGTVRALEEKGTCYIGRLAVHPDFQNQGIGTALMKEIEKLFRPMRYELFAGSKSNNNIHLYKKLGYEKCEKSQYECGDIELIYFEKIIQQCAGTEFTQKIRGAGA